MSSIVRLNVGGTKYEVARTTIEKYPDTMLAKLVSDLWQQNPQEELFIDRDGETFRYVLAYMRDGMVPLPSLISKGQVLQELNYFGFENVPDGTVEYSTPRGEVARSMERFAKEHRAKQMKRDLEKDCCEIAFQCYLAYPQATRAIFQREHKMIPLKHERFKSGKKWEDEDMRCLKHHMKEYGLILKDVAVHTPTTDGYARFVVRLA